MKFAGLLLALAIVAPAAEPDLSPAEKANIAKQIAAMKGAPDRQVAEGFTNAKKVAEYLLPSSRSPRNQKAGEGRRSRLPRNKRPGNTNARKQPASSGHGQLPLPGRLERFQV
jgi:hypothetical protein